MHFVKRGTSTGIILLGFVLIIIASLLFPYSNNSEGAGSILTVSTFLFGIFAGFVIASRLSRYYRYRDLLTNETGYLISYCKYAGMISESFGRKITDLVDKYLLETFLYEVYEYHGKTEPHFYDIINGIKGSGNLDQDQESIIGQMRTMVKEMLKDREELFLLGKDKITFWLKTTLMILAGIILYSLFLLREQTVGSFILTVLLSGSVVIVLVLIRDLDKLRFHDETMSYGIYYRVFDAIGKPRLYTNESFSRRIVPPKGSSYRFAEIVRNKDMAKYRKIVLVSPKNFKRK